MERTLTITRKYQLSQFQNLDIGTMYIELPEKLAMNQELVEALYYLQLVTGDKIYRKYFELDAKLEALGERRLDQQFKLLEAERLNTMEEIKKLIMENK